MTRREKLEARLEKRRQWAASRKADAERRFKASHELLAPIPMGQPILVGHHSEKRHRATLKRSDNHMRAGCESAAMAKHHEQAATGLEIQLDRSIFSDDEDAIEQIQAKIASLEVEREQNNKINKIVRDKPKNEATPAKLAQLQALGLGENAARQLFTPDFCGRIGIPSYVNQNLGGNISRYKKRLEHIARRQQRSAAAEATPHGVALETSTDGKWATLTFADKPERDILTALKEAGYRWGAGCWSGARDKLPECVLELLLAGDDEEDEPATPAPHCDDPGAHRPGCQCAGGEALL